MGARAKINNLLLILIIAVSIAIKCLPLSKERKLSLGYSQNSVLNFTEATAKNFYRSEEHTVVTEDGYMLTLFRIPKARDCSQKKKIPVLMLHGLLQNSDTFLNAGPSSGLAYLLADACYDVWMGNQRGNNYARRHLTLDPDRDTAFWQFSADEIGYYDIPATIDYILKLTNADKLNYIGFSQGAGAFFIMCSERPGYCEKTGVMVALAPAVVLHHAQSLLSRFMIKFLLYFKPIFEVFRIHEVFKKGDFSQELMEGVCQVPRLGWIEVLCGSSVFLDNYHAGSITFESRRLIFSHLLMGTSLNTVVRYGQILQSGKFQKLDYGPKMNLERYNSTRAPEYNLTAVNIPVVIIQGKSDNLIDIRDTRLLSTKLPHVLEMVEISDPEWTHFDMMYSKNIKEMVYPKIEEYLEIYSEDAVSVSP